MSGTAPEHVAVVTTWPPATWPPPEVPCRAAVDTEVPRTAFAIASSAQRAGWVVDVTYARGTAPTRYWEPGPVVDSIAVRLRRGSSRGVGTWVNGRWRAGFTWSSTEPLHPVGARGLAAYVMDAL